MVIAGAGPAGCAAAIALASHAPSLRVVQIAPRATRRADLGEYVPASIELLLRRLDVWDTFVRDGHRASSRRSFAWGSPFLSCQDRLFRNDHVAWRLDRRRFDVMLQRASAAAVQTLDAEVAKANLTEHGISLRLSDAVTVAARFAIDATGRRAIFSRSLGAPVEHLDRLVAVACPAATTEDRRDLRGESDEHGWWYATDRADGSHLLVRMSDADVVHHARLVDPAAFVDHLRRTRHIGADASLTALPTVHAATSRRILPLEGAPLIAAGDAAWTQDPISGEGIVKALRSGFYAAYTAKDCLAASDIGPMSRYNTFVDASWRQYRKRLKRQYSEEARWPQASFWRRRWAI